MPKKAYVGISDVARNSPKEYIGINDVARKVIKGYIGDENNIARQYWPSLNYDGYIFLNIGEFGYNSIFYTPALAKGASVRFPDSNYNLNKYKALLFASLGSSKGVLWPSMTQFNHAIITFESFVNNPWQVDTENYIYKVEQSTDYRTENIAYFPITRMYADVQYQSGVYYFDFEVEAKGISNLIGQGVTVWMDLRKVENGQLVTVGYASFTANTNTFDKYIARCSLPWNYDPSQDIFIDYIGFQADVSMSGVQNEIYIKSVKMINYRYKNCLALEYEKSIFLQNKYGYINDYKLVIPCGKNSLQFTSNNLYFDLYKVSGEDDVFIVYFISCADDSTNPNPNVYKYVSFYIRAYAVSKKPFTLSYNFGYMNEQTTERRTVTANVKQTFAKYPNSFDYYTTSALDVYGYSKMGTTIDFSSPNCPQGNIPPISIGHYHSEPEMITALMYLGKYYGGAGYVNKTFKQGFGSIDLCVKHAVQVFIDKISSLNLPATFENLFNTLKAKKDEIIAYLISQKNYGRTHNMCEVSIYLYPTLNWERIDVIAKFENVNSNFSDGVIPISSTVDIYGEQYYTSAFNLGNSATQCKAYAQITSYDTDIQYGVNLSSDTTATFSGCKIQFYDNLSYAGGTMKAYRVDEVSLTSEYTEE